MAGAARVAWAAMMLGAILPGCATPPDASTGPSEPVVAAPTRVTPAPAEGEAPAEPRASDDAYTPGTPPERPADSTTTTTAQKADRMMSLAREASAARDWPAAAEIYGTVTQIDPDRAEAWHRLGVSLRKLGRLDDAMLASRQALELDPRHAAALTNVGNILYRQGDHQGALRELRRAVDLDPQLAEGPQQPGHHPRAVGSAGRSDPAFPGSDPHRPGLCGPAPRAGQAAVALR